VTWNRAFGRRGEDLAAERLQRQGYRVLARNLRTPLGELDLVCEDGPEVVFVEVKARRAGGLSAPEEAVGSVKLQRLARLAEAFLLSSGRETAMWRIDVVAIEVGRDGQLVRFEHYRNAGF
jgi:putative endonuclease